MSEHPIQGLMTTAMNSIKDMIDVNTIIGDPINANNSIIIPISKVSFGFAAGGSEFKGETIDGYTKKDKEEEIQYRLPFGGGSGAGVNINPIAFLIVQENNVKLLPVDHASSIDKLLDYMPDLVEKANCLLNKLLQKKQDECCKENEEESEKENKQENERNQEDKNNQKPEKDEPTIVTTYEFEEIEEDDDNLDE